MNLSLSLSNGSSMIIGGGQAAAYPWLGDADISGFIPDSANVLFNGSDVETITDQGNSFTLGNAAPTEQPLWSATSVNGHPGYALNGTTDVLYSTDAGLLAFAAGEDTPCMIVSLLNVTSSASGDCFAGFFNTGTSGQMYRHIQAGATHRVDRSTLHTSTSFQSVVTGIQLFAVLFDGTSARLFRNGTEDPFGPFALNAASLTFNRFSVGANFNGSTTPANLLGATCGGHWLVKGASALTKYQSLIEPWALTRGGL